MFSNSGCIKPFGNDECGLSNEVHYWKLEGFTKIVENKASFNIIFKLPFGVVSAGKIFFPREHLS